MYKGADGIKTGYTAPAGFNLTASAERDGVRIIATIFGGTSTPMRNAKMAELLDLGFKKAKKNVKAAPPVAPAAVSYTHLDVYKRQGEGRLPAAQCPAAAAQTAARSQGARHDS